MTLPSPGTGSTPGGGYEEPDPAPDPDDPAPEPDDSAREPVTDDQRDYWQDVAGEQDGAHANAGPDQQDHYDNPGGTPDNEPGENLGPAGGATGITGDPTDTVADDVEEASENLHDSPEVEGDPVTSDEFQNIQDQTNELGNELAEGVNVQVPEVSVPEVPSIQNPFSGGLLGWTADNLDLVVIGIAFLASAFILKPYAEIAGGLVGDE
jgi:hypothetical protein